jgi:hypothetical protein
MDPVRSCVALGPLALYLLVIAGLNLGRRPFLTTGARDIAALGIGAVGLALVGPGELLLPTVVSLRVGALHWLLLAGLYISGLTLIVLVAKPRLVIYNVTFRELRPLLAGVVDRLDPAARWAGDSVYLPHLQVEFHLEEFPVMRNVSLVATSPRQNLDSWHVLEAELRTALADLAVSPNTRGFSLATIGLFLLGVIVVRWAQDVGGFSVGLLEMFGF